MTIKITRDFKIWKYSRLFLDTNVLFKLVAQEFKEPGTENLISYIQPGVTLHTCDYCIGEVMGILKRKWLSKKEKPDLTTDKYLFIIHRLNRKIDTKKLILHELPLTKYFHESTQFVRKYDIDYIDALLLNFVFHSKDQDLFVTADGGLSKAAKELGASCWNILDCESPPE